MGSLGCCFWWLLLGVLLGWLLNWLLAKLRCSDSGGCGRSSERVVERASAQRAMAAPVVAPVDYAAARAAGFDLQRGDELTVIEGIGPKISGLLRELGVTSFAQLAEMPLTEIQALLNAGGDNFRLAKPDSWPEQAALAAANRWTDLKRLQDELVGGVRPTSV